MATLKRKRTLQVFKSGDEQQLWHIAQELYETGFFNCYLTSQQFNLLVALLSFDKASKGHNPIWNAFLKGALILRFKEDAGDDSNSNENMYMKPGYPALRNLNATIRYLLYEKAIDYYFFKNSDNSKEFQLLEDNIPDTCEPDKTPQRQLPIGNTAAEDSDDDDNYDEEEEEEGNADDYDDCEKGENGERENNIQTGKTCEDANADEDSKLIIDKTTNDYVFLVSKEELLRKPAYPSVSEITADEEAIGNMVHPILGTTSAIESSVEKQNELKLMKNFNKTYHGFENDLPNILKKRKLERSDKQLEMSEEVQQKENTDDSDSKQVNKLMSLGGAVNLSLKNLLQRIENNRDKLGVTDLELKNLIMDVRKNRSKWANYNKIGQEELYEACEKVVTELRGYTEHSTPFLNRVSKREAPNYYQIIKKPMDLNTVLKKLKTLQYQNKTQFVEDLMLIWQNCLTYNSDPKHFLRIDALAMRKKTLMLIPLIPDITIRDRAEVEKEAAELAIKEKNEGAAVGRTSARGVGNKVSRKGRKGVNIDNAIVLIDGPSSVSTPRVEDSLAESKVGTPSSTAAPLNGEVMDKSTAEQTNTTIPANADDDEIVADQDEDDEFENMDDTNMDSRQIVMEDLNEDNDDLELSTWKTLTSTTRYKLCNERSKLFNGNKIQPNTEATIRTKSQMYNFSRYLEDNSKIVLHKNRKYYDENDDPYLIEYDVAGGVPEIKHTTPDFDKVEEGLLEKMISEGKTLNDLSDSDLKVKIQGSNGLILENISLMQDIRKICFKINLIRTMQTSQFVHQSQFVAPTHPRITFEDIDPMSKLSTRNLMTEQIASSSLKKSMSALVMLSGFEQTSPSCAAVLTHIAEDYMCNLAKSLKLHMESKSINKIPIKKHEPLTVKEVLQIVLKYNGVEKPDALYSYYKEQLTKQNKKLIDLKYGLENFLCDLLRPSMQEISENQFNDDSEQFVNGDFSDEIGEDFFGFKELGLDKEFGLLTSNIPLHLLQSKLSYQFSQMNKHMAKRIYEDFEEVKFPKLRKRDIPNQIGILQPFYEDIYLKSKLMYSKQLKKYQTQTLNGETPEEPFHEIENEDDLILIEDDDLPLKQRNNRPKIPPNGKITQIKKKFIPTAFFVEKQDEIETRLGAMMKKLQEDALKEEKASDKQNEDKIEHGDKDSHNDSLPTGETIADKGVEDKGVESDSGSSDSKLSNQSVPEMKEGNDTDKTEIHNEAGEQIDPRKDEEKDEKATGDKVQTEAIDENKINGDDRDREENGVNVDGDGDVVASASSISEQKGSNIHSKESGDSGEKSEEMQDDDIKAESITPTKKSVQELTGDNNAEP